MSPTQHRDAARRFRYLAHVADVCGHLAEERGDRMSAAEQIDEREFWATAAEHHEGIAAYAQSIADHQP